MKNILLVLLALVSNLVLAQDLKSSTELKPPSNRFSANCSVYYSPNGGVTKALVAFMDSAKVSIHMLAYSFTSAEIVTALINAKKRGAEVNFIGDKSEIHQSVAQHKLLKDAGIDIWIDSKHQIAHNKVIIVDGKSFNSGSFNYSWSAEFKNSENALICDSEAGAKLYVDNWKSHQSHSVKQ